MSYTLTVKQGKSQVFKALEVNEALLAGWIDALRVNYPYGVITVKPVAPSFNYEDITAPSENTVRRV